MKKLLAFLLIACIGALLCACGGSNEPAEDTDSEVIETEAEETEPAPAEVKSWGEWSVEVPSEFSLKGGDVFDENDTRYFSVKRSDFYYFDFKADGEELIMKNYEYNKNTYTNEQTDVSATYGSAEWTGFQYSDGFGGYGFEAYATVDGEMIGVSSAGFAFDADVVKQVLGSLKHGEAAAEAETEAETEAAVTYVKTVEFRDFTMGIPEGYTEVGDSTPFDYTMKNNSTAGRVKISNSSGVANDRVESIMSGLTFDKQEYDINDLHWVGAISDDGFYCFASQAGDNTILISIDYAGTMEEMERLINAITLKN